MANFVVRFPSAVSLGAGEVRLIKTASGAWADGAIMTYDSTNKAYELIVTGGVQFGAGIFSPNETYLVSYSADGGATQTVIHDLIMVGDMVTGLALVAHAALHDNVHGVTGHVVGISDAQALTNKTIDGDLNTLLDVSFASMKAATASPAHYIKPGADDTALHLDASSATILTVTAANVAKSADRVLKLVAGSVNVATRAGAAAKITGVLPGTVNGDAADYSQIATLTAAVAALSTTDAFTGSPVCSVVANAYDDGSKDAFGLAIEYQMESDAQSAKAKRWEVYWKPGGNTLPGVTVGAISAADLASLRDTNNGFRRSDRYKEQPKKFYLQLTRGLYTVYVVAFDWTTGQYVSAPYSATADMNGTNRPAGFTQTDEATYFIMEVRYAGGRMPPAAATNDAVQANYTEWVQQAATPKLKDSFIYIHESDITRLCLYIKGKVAGGTGRTATLTMEVYDIDTTAVITSTSSIWYETETSFTQHLLQIDVTGLVVDKAYKIRLMQSAGGAYDGTIRSDWVARVDHIIRTLR